jgi:hypothetical protein
MIKQIATTLTPRFLLGLSLALGVGALLRAAPAVPVLQGTPQAAARTLPSAGLEDWPRVVGVRATPSQLSPLNTATFSATIANTGFDGGPYRATLQLRPLSGGQVRSASQRGFMLRHNQRLTLYWEWRAGASLPPGRYAMRVLLSAASGAAQPLTALTAATSLIVAQG